MQPTMTREIRDLCYERPRSAADVNGARMKVDTIFDAMRDNRLSVTVGGGDPAVIGKLNFGCILDNTAITRSDRVLDFGCGIGRTAVLLADHLSEGRVVGVDIVPEAVKFCQQRISPEFESAEFFCTDSSNPLYTHIIGEGSNGGVSEDEWLAAHTNYFDLAVAFSVFTHFDPDMTKKYFALLKQALKGKSQLLSTWFFDRSDNVTERRLDPGQDFKDTNNNEPLLCAVYKPEFAQRLAEQAGLTLERVSFGWWREGVASTLKGQHYQDLAIFRA